MASSGHRTGHFAPMKRPSTVNDERPRASTRAAVEEALGHCTLNPNATPRSNHARLLFALYYSIGLPFPYGWRTACIDALAVHGIPAGEVELDLLYTAMTSDSAIEFLGWPGIDEQLVRDLMDRSGVCEA